MKRRGPSGTGSFETEFFAEYLPRGPVLVSFLFVFVAYDIE